MKTLLLTIAMVISPVLAAEAAPPVYDPNSSAALEAKTKYEGYTRDGQALPTSALYKELERLDIVNAN